MSTDAHATDQPDHAAAGAGDHHAADDHGGDHGHDDHAHGGDVLGPVDTVAWLAGGLGVVLGLAVAICFVLATSSAGSVPG